MSTATVENDYVCQSWCNFVFDFPQYAQRDTGFPWDVGGARSRNVNVVPQQPLSLSRQSANTKDPYIEIPEDLQHYYLQYRPTPLRRAHSLEAKIKCNARIYYKFEGVNISGSHKLNTALAQAYYYKQAGAKHLVTGTGAGQWGTAISYACNAIGLDCTVFMVSSSLRQKPQRRVAIELFGATLHESPSDLTDVGRAARRKDPNHIGTLGTATGEALEFARNDDNVRFAVGSGENCVLLHQTLIGMEAIEQIASMGDFPTHVVACIGAGSNFGGVGLPFLRAAKEIDCDTRLVAVEPSECPKLTRGRYAYDFSDFSGTTPISKMYTLGSSYTAPAIHAGGLRYHGTSPFLSSMYHDGLFDAIAMGQQAVLKAGCLLAETEGVLPAPESAHAVAGALKLASEHPATADPLVILVNISGHGWFDIGAYEKYKRGDIEHTTVDEAALQSSLAALDDLQAKILSDARPGQ